MATGYVYTPVGWVSGSAPKLNGPDLAHMDAGIQQGAHVTGLESDRTTALASANPGALMWCSDSQILYMSLGAGGWQFLHARAVPVTSLPASAVDGQEIEYVADAANGVRWRFRYNASSSSSHKWECIGGPVPLSGEILAEETTTSAVYTDLATVGPNITLPFAGDYDFEWGFRGYPSSANQDALCALYVGTAQTDSYASDVYSLSAASGFIPSDFRRTRLPGVAAGALAKLVYRVTGGTGFFQKRNLHVWPVRVG